METNEWNNRWTRKIRPWKYSAVVCVERLNFVSFTVFYFRMIREVDYEDGVIEARWKIEVQVAGIAPIALSLVAFYDNQLATLDDYWTANEWDDQS